MSAPFAIGGDWPGNPMAEVKANFRRLLATGKPVAVEDAARDVETPDGFDRRAFGLIPREMKRAGEIVEARFREGKTSQCNQAIKRLWVAVNPGEVARG